MKYLKALEYSLRVDGLRHVSTKFRYAFDDIGGDAASAPDNLDIPNDT
jgi:hypothetical protein